MIFRNGTLFNSNILLLVCFKLHLLCVIIYPKCTYFFNKKLIWKYLRVLKIWANFRKIRTKVVLIKFGKTLKFQVLQSDEPYFDAYIWPHTNHNIITKTVPFTFLDTLGKCWHVYCAKRMTFYIVNIIACFHFVTNPTDKNVGKLTSNCKFYL